MKEYLASIAIFVGVIILLGNLTLKQVQKVTEARQELASAQQNLVVAQRNSDLKNQMLRAQVGSDNVANFMSQYGPSLQSMAEIGTINQRVGAESEALRIPIQEQKTASRDLPGKTATVLTKVPAHEYSIAVLATFRDSLVWLGQVEDAFPFSRTTTIDFTPSGDFVQLKTTIIFPRMDSSVFAAK